MATHYTPLLTGGAATAANFNSRYQELDNAIVNLSRVRGYSLADFGGIGNGSFDNAQAIADIRGLIQLAGAGWMIVPLGEWVTTELLEWDNQKMGILGMGEGSKLITADSAGGILISASYCALKDIWIHHGGSAGWAVKSDNGKIYSPASGSVLHGRGPEKLKFHDVKITTESGADGGLGLINTWHSRFFGLSMPGGDGQAFQMQSGGFNHFYDTLISQITSDQGYNAWDGGIELLIQPPMDDNGTPVESSQQADDTKWFGLTVDGINDGGHDLHIHSTATLASIIGVPPGRNEFYGALFGANGTSAPPVLIEASQWVKFFGCHAEHAGGPPVWEIREVCTDGTWYACSGYAHLHTPNGYQTIRGNKFDSHLDDVEIGTSVWGTSLPNYHGNDLDSGVDTHMDRVPTEGGGGVGTFDRTYKVNSLAMSRLSTGSGGGWRLFMESGVPSNSFGSNGDFCMRTDGGAGSTFYLKVAGAWVARA